MTQAVPENGARTTGGEMELLDGDIRNAVNFLGPACLEVVVAGQSGDSSVKFACLRRSLAVGAGNSPWNFQFNSIDGGGALF